MARVAVWEVTEQGPGKLTGSSVDLEAELEDWIESDPGLLQQGLEIMGRQMSVEGGKLDLLALDPEGRWVVVEIKRGRVSRDTIAQAQDYASCVGLMPYGDLRRMAEEYLRGRGKPTEVVESLSAEDGSGQGIRDVRMFVVGTGREQGLERMVRYLSSAYQVPISLVSYEVFETRGGQRILVRELTEEEEPPVKGRGWRSLDEVLQLARRSGVGAQFESVVEVCEGHGLHLRPYKYMVGCMSPTDWTRTVISVHAVPRLGKLRLWGGSKALAEFYPVSQEAAVSILGEQGWRELSTAQVDDFVGSVGKFFEQWKDAESEAEAGDES